jgi:ABC-type multidrug transport system fused ATPase/permease subunit
MLKRLASQFNLSIAGRAIRLLTPKERIRVAYVILIQIFLGLLDLVGIALIGLLAGLAVSGVGSKQPGDRVQAALNLLNLDQLTLQQQTMALGGLAAVVLVGKTIISIYFVRRIAFFLSRRGALISSKLVSKVLSQSLIDLQSKSMQQTLYAVTTGVDVIVIGVLNSLVLIISDISLLMILSIGLFVVDPVISISTFAIFGFVAISLYKLLEVKSKYLGRRQAELSIINAERTFEVLSSYRELVVRDRRSFYAREIGKIRLELADTLAEKSFLPNLSKYIIEITFVLGALIIGGIQFILNDASRAVAVLAVFLVASARISPAILRLQQSSLIIKSSAGSAEPTLNMIDELANVLPLDEVKDSIQTQYKNFNPEVIMSNVFFRYPEKESNALSAIDLIIGPGEAIAVVGNSGAGKTTLIDVLLGIIQPDTGFVKINNLTPSNAIQKFSGAIGYVPQDVVVINGTIRDNICMGYLSEYIPDEAINWAIEVSQLKSFVDSLPNGILSHVGDRGTKISGGQRQRLGIARALLTRPRLLVLDEATSALDGETESNVTEAIRRLKGDVTVVMIAHRLSTVRQADRVLYMANGEIVSQGTFEEVRNSVPDFDHQAQLMGL